MNYRLGSNERTMLLRLFAFPGLLQEVTENYANDQQAKNLGMVAMLRTAHTKLEKFLALRVANMEQEEKQKLLRMSAGLQVMTMSKEAARIHKKDYAEQNAKTTLDTEDFCDLFEYVFDVNCPKCSGDVPDCTLRRLATKYELEMFNLTAVGCPWKVDCNTDSQSG